MHLKDGLQGEVHVLCFWSFVRQFVASWLADVFRVEGCPEMSGEGEMYCMV